MATPNDLVQRPHHYAIVDEVDSVLIDDARTPLIISGRYRKDRHEFNELKPKIQSIVDVQRKYLTSVLAEAKKLLAEGDTKEGGFQLFECTVNAQKQAAHQIPFRKGWNKSFKRPKTTTCRDNNREMPKVDAELYFVIDEKNNQIELTDKGKISLWRWRPEFFVMPDIGTEIAR